MDGNQDGARLAGQPSERRAHPRHSVDEECQLLLVNHGMPVKGRVLDLSIEGCRVRASEPFPAKAGWTVEVSFKVKGFAFRFCGVVRWSDGHQIAGIHFENMIPRRKVELVEIIDEIAETATRAREASLFAAEQRLQSQAPPRSEPIKTASVRSIAPKPAELLIAAKATAPRVTEKAPEPPVPIRAAESEPPAKAQPPMLPQTRGRDRRGQARHEIDTTATIFLVKVASALRGRIVDLSPGGCRIRTDEKFPVGIYTRVEIEFHLQGLPFRLGGVIQAIHNRNTVGIRLLDLSERKRQQVLELIDEIEQTLADTNHQEELPSQDRGPAENGSGSASPGNRRPS